MIKVKPITIPQLSGAQTRRLYCYLPDDYDAQPEKRYPVLYMFDGHNVFFDSHATYGKSWGMNRYMRRTGKQLIIVAVECNHTGNSRLEEYSPYSFAAEDFGAVTGKGECYMRWLVDTLKPQIDARLRTLPDRAHTAICGSSMGGLMALYAASAYNSVFRRAACLSPSLWVSPEGINATIAHADIKRDTRIYIDYGSRELPCHPISTDALMSVCRALMDKRVNLTFRIVPNGRHCEASWERQIPIFMDCLGL